MNYYIIINISSNAGLLPRAHDPVYSTSKGALIALTRSLALCHSPDQIRVNAVCPTGLTHDSYLGRIEGIDNWLDDLLKLSHQHLDELGHSDDCASLVHYLASDDARFINAQAIGVDAGAMAGPSIALTEAAIGKRAEWSEDDPFLQEPPIA